MLNWTIWSALLDGTWITVQITVLAALLGTSLSIVSGLAGLSPVLPVRWVNRIYVDFFRGTSALVQLYWMFFVLPLLGVTISAFMSAVIVLGLNMGSYGSEVVRGAVKAVPRGQTEASIALNLTALDRMRYVIFPQAVVAMLPPYGNLLIELLKGTALVSLITLSDITFEAQKLRVNGSASTLELLGLALVIYFVLAQAIAAAIRVSEGALSRDLDVGRGGARRST
ncbi:MAG: ectoine/hydroxyectoine ABC transporter permease subunit EhuC [Dehalococcoidia bacterium]